MCQPTADEIFKARMMDEVFAAWYYSRPEKLQAVVREYPYQTYKVKENAPYALTPAGSILHFVAYCDSGNIKVVLLAKDKLPGTIAQEKILYAAQNKSAELFHRGNVTVEVSPQWLTPYFEI